MSKRSHGEGTIRKRKNGLWEGRYTVGHDPKTGKQIQKSVFAKTQKDCREKLQKAISESQVIDYSKERDYTIAEWMETWFEVFSKPYLRVSTANNYRYYIDRYIVPKIGEIKLIKFTNIQAQQFINDLRDTDKERRGTGKVSAKTIKEAFNVLKHAMNQAVLERIIVYNPCLGCKLPKIEKGEMKILPLEKMKQYLEIAENNGYLPLFYLELTTGLRRGELLALEWGDLDVEKRELNVNKSVSRLNGIITVGPTKTKASNRKIQVGEDAVNLLIEEHKRHPDSIYMFPSPVTGELRDPDSISRAHKRIAVKIGEPDLRFHDLRHTFTTYSIMSGVDIKTISQTLGHSSSVITLDVYSHVTSEMKKDAADKIEKLMRNVS